MTFLDAELRQIDASKMDPVWHLLGIKTETLGAEMEKAYKMAHAKFESEKLAHKICAKMLKIMQN